MRTATTRRITAMLALGLTVAVLGACSDGDDGDRADGASDTTVAATTSGDVRTVAVEEFATTIEAEPDRLLIDVRTPAEYETGAIEGSSLIDFEAPDFETRIGALDRAAPYAIYCRSGNRSGQALAKMQEMGFTDVIDLQGGINAWTGAGYPVTQPA